MEELVPAVLPHDATLLMRLRAYAHEKSRSVEDVANSAMLVLSALSKRKYRPLYIELGHSAMENLRIDGRFVYVLPLEASPGRHGDGETLFVEPRSLASLERYCILWGVETATALRHGLTLLKVAEQGCLWIQQPDGGIRKVNIERR